MVYYIKNYIATKLPKNYYSAKFKFGGKSYKISAKKSVFNMRFNKANKNIVVLRNTKFTNKLGLKKLYCFNANLSRSSLSKILHAIRPINTYTLRGL